MRLNQQLLAGLQAQSSSSWMIQTFVIIAVALGIAFEKQNIAFMVSLAFAIAASANFPVLFMSVLWKDCTTKGAVIGFLWWHGIGAFRQERRPLAIGLEMFRKDSQGALDRWVGGGYPINSFLKDYNDNWSMWEKYWRIFDFARRQSVPMVGLNIPREVSLKVARKGFASLPEEERQALGNVQCVVNPEYGEFIRRAMGGHGGHGDRFLYFCEAQMLWDTMMARHLAEFLKANPQHRVVVLAGSGHAWKFGIPRQLLEQMDVTYRVVLPEIDGRLTRSQLIPEVADYLWLDEGPDGWGF